MTKLNNGTVPKANVDITIDIKRPSTTKFINQKKMSLTSKDVIMTSNKSSARKMVTKPNIRSNSKSFGAGNPSASLPSPKYISASNYGRKTIGVPVKK
jgi:hypothetical protein